MDVRGTRASLASWRPTTRYIRPFYWTSFLAASLLGGGFLSLWLGQDTNFDLRNYHLYNAWSYISGRLGVDLYAAGLQTYFSPFLDLPYYILSTKIFQHAPALIAFIMGLPFGALAFLSCLMAWRVLASSGLRTWTRLSLSLLTAGFGLSGVQVVTQIGTTFNEIQIAVIVLLGLLLLLRNSERSPGTSLSQPYRPTLYAGCLFGLAAALKLTAGLYAPGGALVALMSPGSRKQRLLRAAIFSLAWLIVFAVVWGPWGYKIFRLTGNPFFPLFNNIFRSDWSAPVGAMDPRFKPAGWLQTIFYPFYWCVPNNLVIELDFRDIRFACILGSFLLNILVLIFWCGVAARKNGAIALTRLVRSAGSWQIGQPGLIVVFFVASYIIWELAFSILRYTVPLAAIAGIVLWISCAPVFSLLANRQRAQKALRFGGFSLILIIAAGSTAYPSYGRISYGRDVFDVDVPKIQNGSLVIFGDAPVAYVAPYISRQAPKTTFVGGPTYLTDEADFGNYRLGRQIFQRIAAAKQLYVVYNNDDFPPDPSMNDLGLTIDYRSCQPIMSNISTSLEICGLSRQVVSTTQSGYGYEMKPVFIKANKDISFSQPTCTDSQQNTPATIKISSTLPAGKMPLNVYIVIGGGKPIRFGFLNGPSTASTGDWVMAGDQITIEDNTDAVIASALLLERPCRLPN